MGIVAYPLRRFAPRHPCLRGTKKNGKRKSASKREQRKCIYSTEREQVQDDGVGLNLRVSESMVGTRHAVSDNNSKSGLGMPSPYIPEREQIQDDGVGLNRKTGNSLTAHQ